MNCNKTVKVLSEYWKSWILCNSITTCGSGHCIGKFSHHEVFLNSPASKQWRRSYII